MKLRFSTLDLQAELPILVDRLVGMRLANVYDMDSKTYLFKFSRNEEKRFLLVESGIRLHLTDFSWPKNPSPSGFAMKVGLLQMLVSS